MTKLAAIIPAAGLSSRMESFKPLLPLGKGTVLSQCLELFSSNDVEQIVVTGRRGKEVGTAASRAGAEIVHNVDYEQGMFSSILAGMRALASDVTAFFVLPVDIPLVRHVTVARLIEEYERHSPLILYPRFGQERGHPPLVSRELLPEIMAHDGIGGLRTVLERFESGARDLDVADFGTVHDLDYPADYDLARSLANTEYPSEKECQQLWSMYSVPLNIVGHCRAVSCVGEGLCEKLNSRNGTKLLNLDLVRGGALTHDIGKGTKRHEIVGAERLHVHGFHVAADIVLDHSDLILQPHEPISEKEVVFLADKLVRGESSVLLEERYGEKLELYGHEEDVKQAILGRLGRAKHILDRFDREMGISAERLAQEVLG
jgi:putative nucleotidyltransferase with HDIG domain